MPGRSSSPDAVNGVGAMGMTPVKVARAGRGQFALRDGPSGS